MKVLVLLIVSLLVGCSTEITGAEDVSSNLPPTVVLASSIEGLEGSVVELEGAVNDPEDEALILEWTYTENAPTPISADSPSASITLPRVTELTTFIYTLRATDPEGLSASDSISVVVVPENDAPTLTLSGPEEVLSLEEVQITSDARDTDGTIELFQWSQLAGPPLELLGTSEATCTFTAPDLTYPASVVLELLIQDNENAEARARIAIDIEPTNQAPSVDAGSPFDVNENETVLLTAVALDPDEDPLEFEWEQTSGGAVVLQTPNLRTTEFVAPTLVRPEVLVFEVKAIDPHGLEATDTVSVVVYPINQAPLVSAGEDQEVREEVLVNLNGTAHDLDGFIQSVVWRQIAGEEVIIEDVLSLNARFYAPQTTEPSLLVFELEATDDEGLSSLAWTRVRVVPENQAPLVDAGETQLVVEEEVFSLRGTASDSDGTIAAVAWVQVSGPDVIIDTPDQLETTVTAPTVDESENLIFELKATDNEGGHASDRVIVEVFYDTQSNQPPVVDAGLNQSVGGGESTTLLGTASDADGFIVSTLWTQLNGPEVVLTDSSSLETSFDAPQVVCPTVLRFSLEATDDQGAVKVDFISITVTGVRAETISAPYSTDLEGDDDGGLVAGDPLWQLGSPTSGPGHAHSGSRVWATNLQTNVGHNKTASLCLPGLDRDPTKELSVAFRLWAYAGSGDGLSIQYLDPDNGWHNLPDATPEYDSTQASGFPAWRFQRDRLEYIQVFSTVPATQERIVYLRFHFSSNFNYDGAGVYIDDILIGDEAFDFDDDGIAGLRNEYTLYGTDLLRADTDYDGVLDGTEIAQGTHPLNPADFSGADELELHRVHDFEFDDAGLKSFSKGYDPNQLWQHGTPSSGPSRAHSGTQVWATNLHGNYKDNQVEYLYLPPLNLANFNSPTLSFQVWSAIAGSDDGLYLEGYSDETGWARIDTAWPLSSILAYGIPVIGAYAFEDSYQLVTLPLQPEIEHYRLVFASSHRLATFGFYLDDLAVFDESDDPDGDGLLGVENERAIFGTDPFLADTDGDGTDDGVEVELGTDPLNPADFPGQVILDIGHFENFETTSGGFVAGSAVPDGDSLWIRGDAANGPGLAASGAAVWKTGRAGYTNGARAYLYSPPINLSEALAPVLHFQLWSTVWGSGDGLHVEYYDPYSGWLDLPATYPAYNATLPTSSGGWGTVNGDDYTAVALSLDGFVGSTVKLRFAFETSPTLASTGAFIDDLGITEEATDPDGDGLIGLLQEFILHGTDPFKADSDNDGVSDSDELNAGTDPLTP